MSDAELVAPMRHVLKEQLAFSQSLLETLSAERKALTDRDIDALNKRGETKQAHLIQLESLEVERRQLLEAMGLEDALQHDDPELAELWRNILANLDVCQRENQVNGAMVRTYQTQVQHTLGLLSGNTGAPPVYAADGKAKTGAVQQTIAKV